MSGRRVPLGDIGDLMAPGQPLPFRVLDNLGRLLLNAGQTINDTRQLKALLERGACVEYDDAEAVRRTRSAAAAGAAGYTPSARNKTWFDQFAQQTPALDALLRSLTRREANLPAQIENFAAQHIQLLQRQPDAALFLTVRQEDRRGVGYSPWHALHTATVVLLTARQLDWPADRAASVVKAALTMNCAMTELQSKLAEARDPPTKKQTEQIRAHPEQSAQLLRDCGIGDPAWLTAVAQHHERADGSGYPQGLAQIDEAARLLRAADVFVAKISPRAQRVALSPQVAARQLFQEEQGGAVAGALIKAVGIYPPGDFVKLANGDAAVVVRRAGSGGAAQVASLLAASGKVLPGAPKRDTALPEFAISGPLVERQGLPRVLPEVVFGLLD